jgi:hypothetical protein
VLKTPSLYLLIVHPNGLARVNPPSSFSKPTPAKKTQKKTRDPLLDALIQNCKNFRNWNSSFF